MKQEYKDLYLIKACKDGDLDTVKKLIENGANVNAKNHYGWTALIEASMSGHLKIVQYLVEIGKDKKIDIDAKDNDGSTALIWASRDGHSETVKYLLEKGACINAKNDSGNTALIEASYSGNLETVQYILAEVKKGKKVDIDAKNNDGFSALMYASSSGHSKMVNCLITNDADVNIENEYGQTALNFAGSEIVEKILKKAMRNRKSKIRSNKMGYILLSPEHIKFIDENKSKKWHLFKATNITDTKNGIYYYKYKINNNTPLCKGSDIHPKEEEFKNFESFYKNFGYYLIYNNEYPDEYFNKINGVYYTDESKNTFYYSDKKLIIRAIASILGEIVCEDCLNMLYANNMENYKLYGFLDIKDEV